MKNSLLLVVVLGLFMCTSNFDESEIRSSIFDSISKNELYTKFLCGNLNSSLRSNLNSLMAKGQTHPELENLHQLLLNIRHKDFYQNIPEEYDVFLFSFKDPSYRSRLHFSLLSLQIDGVINGIDRDFVDFTSQHINLK